MIQKTMCRAKINSFKVFNLKTKKYDLGSFFISDEGYLYRQIVSCFVIELEAVENEEDYRIEFEKDVK